MAVGYLPRLCHVSPVKLRDASSKVEGSGQSCAGELHPFFADSRCRHGFATQSAHKVVMDTIGAAILHNPEEVAVREFPLKPKPELVENIPAVINRPLVPGVPVKGKRDKPFRCMLEAGDCADKAGYSLPAQRFTFPEGLAFLFAFFEGPFPSEPTLYLGGPCRCPSNESAAACNDVFHEVEPPGSRHLPNNSFVEVQTKRPRPARVLLQKL